MSEVKIDVNKQYDYENIISNLKLIMLFKFLLVIHAHWGRT